MTREEQAKVNEIAGRVLTDKAKFAITGSRAFDTSDREVLLAIVYRQDKKIEELTENLEEAENEYQELRERTEE